MPAPDSASKPMNHDSETPAEPTLDPSGLPEAEPAKPKRRRAPAKAAAELAPAAVDSEAVAAEAAAPKPRKRRHDGGPPRLSQARRRQTCLHVRPCRRSSPPRPSSPTVREDVPAQAAPKAPRRRSPRKATEEGAPRRLSIRAGPTRRGCQPAVVGFGACGCIGAGCGIPAPVPMPVAEGDAAPRSSRVHRRRAKRWPLRRTLLARVNERFSEVLEGVYDAEAEPGTVDAEQAAPAEAEKRVLRPQPDAPKLQKVLAQSGISARAATSSR